ncbi:hypothetical protein C0995_002703 [Termitomyces sp. Mi166|nr:hypothetical protein C0995_002703 [Termitomyces sp. Mi166\
MEGTIARFDCGNLSPQVALPQEHSLPYTTLPVLHLHVQPHYVVVDLYQKIMKHELFIDDIREDEGYKQYLSKYSDADVSCLCAYRMWKTWGVPSDFIRNPGADYGGETQTNSSGGERLKLRPGAFAWGVDEVGLRPTDSVTYIPDCEDGEDSSDDDTDEYVVDETDSAFQARMRRTSGMLRYAGTIAPTLRGAVPALTDLDADDALLSWCIIDSQYAGHLICQQADLRLFLEDGALILEPFMDHSVIPGISEEVWERLDLGDSKARSRS